MKLFDQVVPAEVCIAIVVASFVWGFKGTLVVGIGFFLFRNMQSQTRAPFPGGGAGGGGGGGGAMPFGLNFGGGAPAGGNAGSSGGAGPSGGNAQRRRPGNNRFGTLDDLRS